MPEWRCIQCQRRFYSAARSDLTDPHCPVCGGLLVTELELEHNGERPKPDRDEEPLKDGGA